MKGRAISYTEFELTWIAARRDLSRRELHSEFCARFGREDVTVEHIKALCTRQGWKTGRTGCFAPGHTPANKCQPHPTRGRAAETQFKKGSRTGRAAEIWKPIGTERISKDGYRERKIHDGMPLQSRWRAVHLIEWEKANGPLPAGHCLKCLDGDKTNTDPSNWEAIPRALLPRLSGGRRHKPFDEHEPEVRPAVLSIAKLEHKAREARKGETP